MNFRLSKIQISCDLNHYHTQLSVWSVILWKTALIPIPRQWSLILIKGCDPWSHPLADLWSLIPYTLLLPCTFGQHSGQWVKQFSIFYHGPKIWILLSISLTSSSSIFPFKKHLKIASLIVVLMLKFYAFCTLCTQPSNKLSTLRYPSCFVRLPCHICLPFN